MIRTLWLVGIGTGGPQHITLEGQAALRDAAAILLPRKGPGKDDLEKIRLRILADAGSSAPILPFDYPERDPALPYQERVARWHDTIAENWAGAVEGRDIDGPVALLVWGDPSLYDSTMRIAERLSPTPHIRVVPGITALQALTAAHAIPLNTVNGPVTITTGRQLETTGWPEGAETLAVMLDGKARFQALDPHGLYLWWGAFLGMPEQITDHGPLADVSARIAERRAKARDAHGWIMDTYLLRRI